MSETHKKDFSNWLIVSDVDGTLHNKLRRLPKNNLEEITRFTHELKGNFTLGSGRNIETLRKPYSKLPISCPAIIYNGAGIYDYKKEDFISYHPIGEKGIEIVHAVMEKFPQIEIEICTKRENYILNAKIFAPVMAKFDIIKYNRYRDFESVPKNDWAKVVFLGFPWQIKKLKKYLYDIKNPDVTFMSSSIVTFELLDYGVNKGSAVLELADLLGIDRKNTGAIGDYFNDYEMLKHVGVPAACGQAPRGMHEIAKFHACHCNKGSVADFLRYIEANY